MDTTYWGRNFGVVIMKDSRTGKILWRKFIFRKETLADYKEGVIIVMLAYLIPTMDWKERLLTSKVNCVRFKTTLRIYYLCKLLLDNEKQVYKSYAHFRA